MQILRLAEMINTSKKKTLCKELKSIMNEGPQRYDCNKPQQLIKSTCTRSMRLGAQKHHWGARMSLKSQHLKELHS